MIWTAEQFREYRRQYYQRTRRERLTKAKQHRKEYPELYRQKYKEGYAKNRAIILARRKIYRDSHKAEIKAYQAQYKILNADKMKAFRQRRMKEDIPHKLRQLLRMRLKNMLQHDYKAGSAVRDLGCTTKELKFYLEGRFKEGMTWANHGKFGWHIDHIIPLAFYDLTDRQQFLKACHYTNLQPLWAKENLQKHTKLIHIQ